MPPPSSARPFGAARFLPPPNSVLGPPGLRAEWREAVATCDLEFEFELHIRGARPSTQPAFELNAQRARLQRRQRAGLRERRTLRAAPVEARATRRGRGTQPAPGWLRPARCRHWRLKCALLNHSIRSPQLGSSSLLVSIARGSPSPRPGSGPRSRRANSASRFAVRSPSLGSSSLISSRRASSSSSGGHDCTPRDGDDAQRLPPPAQRRSREHALARPSGRSAPRSRRSRRAPTGANAAHRRTVRGQLRRERDSNPR